MARKKGNPLKSKVSTLKKPGKQPPKDPPLITFKRVLFDENTVVLGTLNLGFACIPGTKSDCELVRVQIPCEDSPILIQSLYTATFLKDLIVNPILICESKLEDARVTVNIQAKIFEEPVDCASKYINMLYRIITTLGLITENEKHPLNLKIKLDINELYVGVRELVDESMIEKLHVQHSTLKPELRPYQVRAVQWMLHQERNPIFGGNLEHPLYCALVTPENQIVYYNSYSGHITKSLPTITSNVTGGLLADEMGLGKTVEVLACILCNPRHVNESDSGDEIIVEVQKKNRNPFVEKLDGSDQDIPTKKKRKKKIKVLPKRTLVVFSSDDEIPLAKYNKISDSKDEEPTVPDVQEVGNSENLQVVEAKSKLSIENFVKKEKPAYRVALDLWYQQKLTEVTTNLLRHRPVEQLHVHCLCGSFEMVGEVVVCSDCQKKQHRLCVNYTGDKNEFCCPQCWEKRSPIASKGTLIVVPSSLRKQWVREIQKHIHKNRLKVLTYKGVSTGYVYPLNLAKYDIVLTTYSVLQSEVKYVGSESERSSRFERKYHVGTSPLLSLQWWRVCLDEAQIVGGATTEVANMSQRLNSVHKWAISGTPAQRGVCDLFGIIQYLGVEPYSQFWVWKAAVFHPYYQNNKYPMHKLLSNFMWRSCKSQVLDQVNLTKQTEIIHWLKFNAVEDYFYQREHELCYDGFQDRISRLDSLSITLNDLDRRTLGWLLQPLLAIRQVCSHPNAVKGKYLTTKNNIMSMGDLLEALITKIEQECADAFRAKIAALNGLAGLSIITGNWNTAGEHYRDVLRLIDQHKDEITVDTLPHLHTLVNLAEVLQSQYSDLPPTLRDDNLLNEAHNLEKKYIQKHLSGLSSAVTDYHDNIKQIRNLEDKFESKILTWFPEFIHQMVRDDLMDDLFNRIENALADYNNRTESNFKSFSNLMEKLTSVRELISQITKWWDNVEDRIEDLRDRFEELDKSLENGLFSLESVQEVVACHLRPIKTATGTKKKKVCFICQIEKDMFEYECLIFVMKTKKAKTEREKLSEEDRMEGTWKASQQEIVLKSVFHFTRNKDFDENILIEPDAHLKICEHLRKEFQEMRKVWTYYGDLIAAQDELSMCKERLRLRLGNEPLPSNKREKNSLKNLDYTLDNKTEFINIIELDWVPFHQANLTSDLKISDDNFTSKFGSLTYLKTLRKQQYGGKPPDPCPICKNNLEDNWSVLICGHCYCLECIHNLLYKFCKGTKIMCSVCRQEQEIADIAYVRLRTENSTEVPKQEIKGSFSTKIEEIVRILLNLLENDPDVKVLIFSNWEKVIKVLSEALTINQITSLKLTSANPDILDKFKNLDIRTTALLLPFSIGSKGLNLIEATHVFLVEPLMNPNDELQAISRVHRIGQTKPTFVHRFLIKNTIEESIYNAVAADVVAWQNDNITVARIFDLFCKNSKRKIQQVVEDLVEEDDPYEESVPADLCN